MFRIQQTPPLSYLLDDLLTRNPQTIAAHLGVTVKTLDRWKAADQAPRAAMLALFYETQWGYSVLETTAHNGAMYARQLADSLARENAMLRARIGRLEAIGNFGAANEPMHAPSVARQTIGPLSSPAR